jgi:hypothetical protein
VPFLFATVFQLLSVGVVSPVRTDKPTMVVSLSCVGFYAVFSRGGLFRN